MKTAAKSVILLLCLTGAGGAQRPIISHLPRTNQTPPQQPAPSAMDLVSGYRDAAANLQSTTKLPLRLPNWVPYDDDKDNPVYATVVTATANGYQIELAWVPDCQGAGACHMGYITGGSVSPLEDSGKKIPVTLNGGIQGYFIDASCGANCDDSAVYWTEGNNHYSISMKAEKMDTLVKMANSALGSK